jgi:hypothetical protein
LGSTFTHFRSQLLLPPLASQPQPDQLESSASSGQGLAGRGVGPAAPAAGAGGAAQATTTGSGASATSNGGTTRDSLYEMANRLSAWPSEKVEKVKHLRDQFLSKV